MISKIAIQIRYVITGDSLITRGRSVNKISLCVLWLMGTLISHSLWGQNDVSVRVQVNRTPHGHYPTKVYQFQTTPGLVQVTLTNHSGNSHSVYLTGSLTGDNGVRVTTSRDYRPESIALKPLETKTLNAVEAGALFDPNRLVYVSGSTSIRPTVFGEQGLPPGTYQVCVRAFDVNSRRPLSEEDPLGCSNFFSITTLEPPVILNPFDASIITDRPVQNIPLRWTTPPGRRSRRAPPCR